MFLDMIPQLTAGQGCGLPEWDHLGALHVRVPHCFKIHSVWQPWKNKNLKVHNKTWVSGFFLKSQDLPTLDWHYCQKQGARAELPFPHSSLQPASPFHVTCWNLGFQVGQGDVRFRSVGQRHLWHSPNWEVREKGFSLGYSPKMRNAELDTYMLSDLMYCFLIFCGY